jgi:hypothetical protein
MIATEQLRRQLARAVPCQNGWLPKTSSRAHLYDMPRAVCNSALADSNQQLRHCLRLNIDHLISISCC